MPRRQPLPRIWLMTDERIHDLMAAVGRLPRGAGIVFRHYATPARARRALFAKVRAKAKARRITILLAGPPQQARQWRADGAHDRSARASSGLRTAAVHSPRERVAARRAGAALIFVSPVFATESHPGARGIGPLGARRIAGADWQRTILLGGMDARRFKRLGVRAPYGWAAINALNPMANQNLNAVPI